MSTPVTPQFYADTVVLQNVSINYKPVWDGSAWVMTPSEIRVVGTGFLGEDGTEVIQADIDMNATQLPPAGQSALQSLLQYVEQELADKYSDVP